MRYVVLFLLLTTMATAVSIDGYVNDFAGVLTPAEEQAIEQELRAIDEKGQAEIAVVTIDTLEGRAIDEYAFSLADGVLGEKEKNNGLLLMIAIEEREWDFEVGRGLEPIIPDIIAARIGREYLVPHFRQEEYGKGILEAMQAVKANLNEELDSEYYTTAAPANTRMQHAGGVLAIVIFLIIVMSVFSAIVSKKRREGNIDADEYFFAAWALASMMGGRGRGGLGGGFGGFGGGSFGGGGASGGW